MAWQVDDALRVTARPADVPVERPVAAAPRPLAPPPAVASIGVPDDPRLRLAATAVADALVERGRSRPTTGATGGLQARLEPGLPDEAYRLDPGPVVVGSTPDGVAAGLYAVADRIRAGAEVVADGRVVAPRLGPRLTDLGAVGLPDDPARFAGGADYSLNSDVVGTAVLPDAPFVDQAAVDGISRQFRALVHHALADGYNAVVVPGFLEYVTFDGLGVHAAGDPHPERAEAMIAAFGPVWRYAHEMVEASRADRALVWVVPAAAVVLSRAVLTWFAAPAHLVPVLVAWALFAVALLRSVLLGVLAVRGPGAYWFGFWTDQAGRAVYVAVAVAAFLGVFAAAYAALRGDLGRAGAAGRVLAAVGTPLAVLGAVVAAVGLERALTAWNDQSALLPWGLSRILGITAHLEVPTVLPVVALLVGGVAVLLGAALPLGARRRSGATTARP